jgi:hypothetical protein
VPRSLAEKPFRVLDGHRMVGGGAKEPGPPSAPSFLTAATSPSDTLPRYPLLPRKLSPNLGMCPILGARTLDRQALCAVDMSLLQTVWGLSQQDSKARMT